MALTVEINEWPAVEDSAAGTRLMYDLGWEATDQLTLQGRVGYAARGDGIEGGTVFGLSTILEF